MHRLQQKEDCEACLTVNLEEEFLKFLPAFTQLEETASATW